MLITAAFRLTAAAIALAAALHVPSGDGAINTFMPGQTPTIPRPLRGAAATEVTGVPWASPTGASGLVVEIRAPANSG